MMLHGILWSKLSVAEMLWALNIDLCLHQFSGQLAQNWESFCNISHVLGRQG